MTRLVELPHHRFVRQFILASTGSGKMFYQMLRHRLNTADHAAFIISLFEGSFHFAANLFPFARADLRVNPTIGNNFHGPVGEQQINKQAVVVLGIPYPRLRKHVDGAFSRGLPLEQRRAVQCALHDETDFADVRGFARFDRLLNRDQGLAGKSPVDFPVSHYQMSKNAFDIHRYHLPDAPPPPKPPPPPPKPPPPKPPPPNPPLRPPTPNPPIPPPSKVNTSAITPATNAMDTAPANSQARTATTPPVASAPGNLPSTARSTPPMTSARIRMTGAYC